MALQSSAAGAECALQGSTTATPAPSPRQLSGGGGGAGQGRGSALCRKELGSHREQHRGQDPWWLSAGRWGRQPSSVPPAGSPGRGSSTPSARHGGQAWLFVLPSAAVGSSCPALELPAAHLVFPQDLWGSLQFVSWVELFVRGICRRLFESVAMHTYRCACTYTPAHVKMCT